MPNMKCSKSDPPLGAIIVSKVTNAPVKVEWGNDTSFEVEGIKLSTSASIVRYFGRTYPKNNLYGQDVLSRTEVDHWLTFTLGPLACQGEFAEALSYLNSVLTADKKYLVGDKVSGADYAVFGALFAAGQWQGLLGNNSDQFPNVLKWYKFMSGLPDVKSVIAGLPKDVIPKAVPLMTNAGGAKGGKSGTRGAPAGQPKQTKDEGKFVDLPGAEEGKVIVRFPPEASG